MYQLLALVAALLLGQIAITNVAAAAEQTPEYLEKDMTENRKQKKLKKILAMMNTLGISDPSLARFITTIDANTKNGQLMLYKDRIADGNLTLRYDFSPDDGQKKLGLFYKPDNSNYEYRMHSNSLNVTYKYKF